MDKQIRPAGAGDAAGILAIYAPFCGSDSPVSFEIAPPALEEMAARIAATTEYFPWLVYADGQEVAGYVYATRHAERAAYRWSVNVSAYLHPAYRGRGLGKALYTALFGLLRAQGFYHAYAGITMPNPASVGLHQAMGFTLVGVYHDVGYKSGAWHDVSWWEKLLQPTITPPAEPHSIQELLATPQWVAAIEAGEGMLADK